jgi:hypothetical protein
LVTQFAKLPYPRKQVIYQWLSTSEKIPVLEITGLETNNVFTATAIKFRDAYNGKGNANAPRASFSVNSTTGYANSDTFILTDKTTPFASSWQWQVIPSTTVKFVNGTTAQSRNPRIVFTQKGKYSLTLIASNFGGSDDTTVTDLFDIDEVSGLPVTEKETFQIYPNPGKGVFTVSGLNISAPYTLRNLQGQIVNQGWMDTDGMLDLSAVSPGTYFISFYNGYKRLIIQP